MVEALARLVRRLVATCLSSLLVLATASARLLLGLLLLLGVLGVLGTMPLAHARLVIRLLLTAPTRRLGRGRAANLVIFRRRRLILTCHL